MLLLCHNYYRMNQIDQESNTIINSRDISVDAASLVMSIRMGGKKMNDLQVRSFLDLFCLGDYDFVLSGSKYKAS